MERIHSSSAKAKKAHRLTLKNARQAIHPFKRMCAARASTQLLRNFSPLQSAKRVGSYLDVNGEFPMAAINAMLLQQQKTLFFPKIEDFKNARMHFAQWTSSSRLKANKFEIPEIVAPTLPHSRALPLDLIFVPLLGFDNTGNRLGMGGGFYDRYLANYTTTKKPFVLGVAYDIQRLAKLKVEPWDYPLDAILTETGIQRFRR